MQNILKKNVEDALYIFKSPYKYYAEDLLSILGYPQNMTYEVLYKLEYFDKSFIMQDPNTGEKQIDELKVVNLPVYIFCFTPLNIFDENEENYHFVPIRQCKIVYMQNQGDFVKLTLQMGHYLTCEDYLELRILLLNNKDKIFLNDPPPKYVKNNLIKPHSKLPQLKNLLKTSNELRSWNKIINLLKQYFEKSFEKSLFIQIQDLSLNNNPIEVEEIASNKWGYNIGKKGFGYSLDCDLTGMYIRGEKRDLDKISLKENRYISVVNSIEHDIVYMQDNFSFRFNLDFSELQKDQEVNFKTSSIRIKIDNADKSENFGPKINLPIRLLYTPPTLRQRITANKIQIFSTVILSSLVTCGIVLQSMFIGEWLQVLGIILVALGLVFFKKI